MQMMSAQALRGRYANKGRTRRRPNGRRTQWERQVSRISYVRRLNVYRLTASAVARRAQQGIYNSPRGVIEEHGTGMGFPR